MIDDEEENDFGQTAYEEGIAEGKRRAEARAAALHKALSEMIAMKWRRTGKSETLTPTPI